MKINIRHITGLYGTNICRFLLAAVFIFSGFVKAIDPLGSLYKMQDYLTAFGMGELLPAWFILLAAILLSAVEFTLGVYLLLGIRRNFTSITTLAFMSFMTLLTLYLAIANPIHDCGCFGDALVLTNTETFLKNVVLLGASFLVFKQRALIIRLISLHSAWIASTYTWIFVFALSFYCLRNLPILDFRPYKIGHEVKASMENFDPVYQDFYLTDARSGEELADSILTSGGYTFLLVARQLERADDSNIDLINELYDYCTTNGYGFYALTASGDEQIQEWREKTGAEYPFCHADDITMKTMIRSNPGVMLLKGDTIVNKWSNSRLPDEYVLNGRLEQIPIGSIAKESGARTLSITLLWFLVPLFVVIGLDRIIPLLNKKQNKRKMRKNIVAGNWKMNKSLQEGIALAKELNEVLAKEKPNCDVVICTPFIHLASVTPLVDANIIGVGAENCADKECGAYTGEVSASMVASTGAKYVILGHSERRAYYGETVPMLEEKVKLALAHNLTPIFCIGEVLEEREANKQNEVVAAQLASVFSLSAEEFGKIVLAYEPVWAIGTGKTATPAQAQEIHAYIRSLVAGKYGKEVADNCSILYGGSCKPSNAKELFDNPDVDGGLIGGAALNVADFKGIIDAFN